MSGTLLRIDASARYDGSLTRALSAELADGLLDVSGGTLLERDLAPGIEFVDEQWLGANFTPEGERTPAQRERLQGSDALIEELKSADTVVIGSPVYNFGVPATLKAWVDQVCRARLTFRYTEDGPEGLLEDKRAFLILSSGGTGIGESIDFASGYLTHVLGFIGIDDVTLIDAGRTMVRGDAAAAEARERMDRIVDNQSRAA